MTAVTLATQVAADVYLLPVPTPWDIGAVNVYFIDDEPPTLVDTGPWHVATLEAIEAGLRAVGRSIADLGRILLTHQHIDHWGLCAAIADRSAAEVTVIAPLAPWLERYPESIAADDALADALLRDHGVPTAVRAAVRARNRGVRHAARAVQATRLLRDGDIVPFENRVLRVHARPGHSPTDTLFHDEEHRYFFGGDHLFAGARSMPVPGRGITDTAGRGWPPAFAMYLKSLRATRALNVDLALPGHGPAITDPTSVIDARLADYQARIEYVAELLAERPRTAFEVLSARSSPRYSELHHPLSEVLGFLDVLVDAGRVEIVREADRPVRFKRTERRRHAQQDP
jgi:glyoxylase-like metal-dependent hydrolase (beta-lactamase superfamily II)